MDTPDTAPATPLDAGAEAVVLIATYNRAALLGRTLDALARTSSSLRWQAVVIDNNSSDDTARVVRERIAHFPVPLYYLFERAQGRSSALNAGIAATSAPVIAFTDDDVIVPPGWLDAACRPLLERGNIEYTGGPVRPLWESPRPAWLDAARGDLWGTIAIQDHGPEPFIYEERRKVPLGANMAARRSLFDRIGLFRADLGRTSGKKILGQEVPELLSRARAAGARGLYVPAMGLDHHVPAQRLTKSYFRRWWYGKGVSRAALDRIRPVTELGIDLAAVRRLAGVPRFMWGDAARDVARYLAATVRRDPIARARHEMMLAYFAGYVAGSRRRVPPDRDVSLVAGSHVKAA